MTQGRNVRKRCWENGADRLAWCTVATDPEFVENTISAKRDKAELHKQGMPALGALNLLSHSSLGVKLRATLSFSFLVFLANTSWFCKKLTKIWLFLFSPPFSVKFWQLLRKNSHLNDMFFSIAWKTEKRVKNTLLSVYSKFVNLLLRL